MSLFLKIGCFRITHSHENCKSIIKLIEGIIQNIDIFQQFCIDFDINIHLQKIESFLRELAVSESLIHQRYYHTLPSKFLMWHSIWFED